jgi:hypothetical protein
MTKKKNNDDSKTYIKDVLAILDKMYVLLEKIEKNIQEWQIESRGGF